MRGLVVGVAVAAAVVVPTAASAQSQLDQSPVAISPAPVTESALVLDRVVEGLPATKRGQLYVNTDLLYSLAQTEKAQRVSVQLFEDAAWHEVRIDTSRSTEYGLRLSGSLDVVGTIRLVVYEGAVAGTVRTPNDGTYYIRSSPDNAHVVVQVDPSEFAPEAPPLPAPETTEQQLERQQSERRADPPSDGGSAARPDDTEVVTVDVLVAYTRSVGMALGRRAATALIGDYEEALTDALRDSGVLATIRIVPPRYEVDFQKGIAEDDAASLRDPAGRLRELHDLRDLVGADLVHLIVQGVLVRNNGMTACGISTIGPVSAWAFSISGTGCGELTFAHEIGHLMGLSHDYGLDHGTNQAGRSAYSYGYISPDSSWRTIMAENDETRIARFSSPRRRHPDSGSPTGDAATADAARSLNETRHEVACFRP